MDIWRCVLALGQEIKMTYKLLQRSFLIRLNEESVIPK